MGDSAFANFEMVDLMRETELISLQVHPKANSKRKDTGFTSFIKLRMSEQIESSISEIKTLFLRNFHAIALKGCLLKMELFLFALLVFKIN